MVPSTQPCRVLGESGQFRQAPPRCTLTTLPSKETSSTEPPWYVLTNTVTDPGANPMRVYGIQVLP